MSSDIHKALVPYGGGKLRVMHRRQLPALLRRASRSLASLTNSPSVQLAAAIGGAIGVGYQLGRTLMEGRLASPAGTARAISRAVNRRDSTALEQAGAKDEAQPLQAVLIQRTTVRVTIVRGRRTLLL